jgi:polysaccharide pyruvyl transferase WcaK-like protein
VRERFDIKALQIDTAQHGVEQPGNRILSKLKKLGTRLFSELDFWLKRPSWFRAGDQFIVVGTGAVDDMAVKHPWNAPYDLFKWCTVAKWGGAQVIFLSVGVGPIMNRVSRILMLRALRMAHYRSYRDQAAFDYLHSVHFDTSRDVLYPDLVFSLPEESSPSSPPRPGPPKVVGLGLINYYGWRHDPEAGEIMYQEYLSKIKWFAGWLLERGCAIRIISGDAIDQRPVGELVEYIGREKPECRERLIVESISNVRDLFHQIAQTDLVVASRFHNVLCSLMLGRPAISLGYHDKNVALMKDMGLEKYCQHIERFTMEKLVEQFESYTEDLNQATQRIRERNKEYRRLLDEQYRSILA